MKESVRYKNSIMQFIQNFKPPSKKGKGDDSSSVGTGVSLDPQEEESLGELSGKKSRKPRKPRHTIDASSLMFKSLMAPPADISELEPGAQGALVEKKPKGKPRVKGKGITIDTSSIVFPSKKAAAQKEEQPVSVSVEPLKKINAKKLTIDMSKLPVLGAKALPQPQQLDVDLSDIPEASEEASPP
jgi:hypothetical protein